MSGTRLRRNPFIVSYWKDGRLIYKNYLNGVVMSASPLCTIVLDFFDKWRQPEELIAYLHSVSPASLRRTLRRLCDLSFLDLQGQLDQRFKAMQNWSPWSPEASFFHFATKNLPYDVDLETERKWIRNLLRMGRQPRFFKHYANAPVVPLPSPQSPEKSEFLTVLLSRRTWREFSKRKVPLYTLAQLLHFTWGVTQYVDIELLGHLPLKTSPSAGARHPTEVYVAARLVEGLPPGLYHYAANRHHLECLRKGAMKRRILAYLSGQWWFAEAAATCIMTAVFRRSMWKYGYSRAYRTLLLDAGHLCQTFCLTATWLGLAPFCTMALADSVIERDLGVDGITESVLYAAGVGWPAYSSSRTTNSVD